ncbi:MAG: tRNA lysidine(34) synthetase TilS [Leptonema sp. (in: Bacteria)]|nr:tRNA lysidine(34) synthetase TilS [Leptonema sp. (in: bacteria)]
MTLTEILHPLTSDDFIVDRKLTYIIGCSGGVDSVVLAHVYFGLYQAGKIDKLPVLFHLNHGLRLSSNRDQQFVKDLAMKLNLPFYTDTVQLNKIVRRTGLNLEEAGRLIRYRRMLKISQELDNSIAVTAHHADDYIESVILKILRGGTDRSFLMPAVTWLPIRRNKAVQVFRPLLKVSRSQIESYSARNSIDFRQDETNFSLDYRRNRIRQTIVPLLKEEGLEPATLWQQVNGSNQRFGKTNLKKDLSKVDFYKNDFNSIDYLCLPTELLNGVSATELKWVIDVAFHRLELGPIQGNYKSGVLFEILNQSKRGRIFIQTNEWQIWSSTKMFWLFKAGSHMLAEPKIHYSNEMITISTDFKTFHYPNLDTVVSVKFFEDGMLTVTGKKLKRIFQQRDTPLPIRRKIPLLVKNNRVVRICFSVKKLGDDQVFDDTSMIV